MRSGGEKQHNNIHHLLSFHLIKHKAHHNQPPPPPPPKKGCMVIRVGQEEEQQQRFVVPVDYLNHPLFLRLLKEAEDEYGFDHKGAITIPCHVEYFRQVQGIIDRDNGGGALGTHHHHHQFHLLSLHLSLSGCFRT